MAEGPRAVYIARIARIRPVALVALIWLAGCSSHPSEAACEPSPAPADCADLSFRGESYNELRPIAAPPPSQMQELGDASYPACNDDPCRHDGLGGLGATDVWLIDGVDPHDAVIGVRQDTTTYVVFVGAGVDPESVPALEELPSP
jgi:hypothetical protein